MAELKTIGVIGAGQMGTEPPVREAGEKVEDVATLVSKLKTAGAI
jgi:hypothetical protein